MASDDYLAEYTGEQYSQALRGEGEYWDSFIANRLLQHDEIPGSVDFRLFFSQFSYKHNWWPPCLGPIAINFREREIRYILQHVAREPGLRVLDLGCGAGWLSLELARQGAHVTAVDISPSNLALGRHMAATNSRNFPYLYQKFAGLPCRLERFGSVEYVYGDLNTIDLPVAEYDIVVSWDSLHHVRDLERLVEQVRAALKPGGAFIGVDHAFASPLTIAFNEAIVPWLAAVNAWIGSNDPAWLYERVISLARTHDWGVLAVDYEVSPVSGFEAFDAQVREELLSIIRKGSAEHPASRHEDVSPFEDVSATRLMRVLIDGFKAVEFRTICPLVRPEQHFAPPRSEAERVFQHYLCAMLAEMGEQAVERGQADGQWFLFHLAPQRPAANDLTPGLLHIKASRSFEDVGDVLLPNGGNVLSGVMGLLDRFEAVRARADALASTLQDYQVHVVSLQSAVSAKNDALCEARTYSQHTESEFARKNAAIVALERRVRQLESELLEARAPRLPWKRRKRKG